MSPMRGIIFRGSVALNACLILYLCLSWPSNSPLSANRRESPPDVDTTINVLYNNLSRKPLREAFPFGDTLQHSFNHVEVERHDTIPAAGSRIQNEVLANPDSPQIRQELYAPQVGQIEQETNPASELDGRFKLIPPQIIEQNQLREFIPQDVSTGIEHDNQDNMVIKTTADRNRASEDISRVAEFQEPPREVQESAGLPEPQPILTNIVEEAPNPPLDSEERKIYPDLHECASHIPKSFYTQNGEYWILNNYIPAAMNFRCDESITYSTHGDYTFLDNLDPLTSRWQGPVSVSVYSPGDDFKVTVDTILYLRNCMAEGIKKYVTFHIFFPNKHVPKKVPTTEELLQSPVSCARDPPKWVNVTTYRQKKKLLYPVNIARNTARLNAQTYFVLPSDIELYPSINFIPDFFNMLKRPDASTSHNPRVYVFPIFEVEETIPPPETKAELLSLLKEDKAILFHHRVCARCHNQPNSTEWQTAPIKPGLSVFVVSHRRPPFDKWEPIYVGTNKEPIYDERLSWEGKSDKMSQMYVLCLRNYEFHILDNAFLVHRPGIKLLEQTMSAERNKLVKTTNTYIKQKMKSEYWNIFGYKRGCNF